MIYANSSTDRDLDTDSEQLRGTNATALNEANADTQNREGAYNSSSGGSSYMSAEKSTTVIVKPTKDGKDGK